MQLSAIRIGAISFAALIALLSWDLSGLDMPLARLAAGSRGFPLRDHWLLTTLLHSGAKYLAWIAIVALCLSVAWPVGALRRVPMRRRMQIAASALLASAFITLLKVGSHTSCPWDLSEFGGIATHVSHWSGWEEQDGGAGHCFPAGHATTGFALVGGFFALRNDLPGLARSWALFALVAGVVLGIGQQLRGAHFMSHTLWTGWLCWMSAWLADPLFAERRAPVADEVVQ